MPRSGARSQPVTAKLFSPLLKPLSGQKPKSCFMRLSSDGLVRLGLTKLVSLSICVLSVTAFSGCDTPSRPMPTSANSFLEAQKLLAAGEKDKAMEAVNASIADDPSTWALFLRAKLHLEQGDEAAALKDCETGLQIEPGDANLAWLKGELAKPAAARFQGNFKNPPTVNR
jgi:tetratricopeptide (TPR) repeat protein